MANFLANLLSSGDYSDLALVCEDQEFKVHNNIEAKTNTFHVGDFDPTTVKLQATGNGKNGSVKSNTGIWIYHGLVNCIADYFCLPGLAKMATAMLDRLTQEDWSEDAFSDLLYGTHGRTGDKDFRVMLATRATDHIGELTARGLFTGIDPPSGDMTPTILRLCVQRLDVLGNDLEAETARANVQAHDPEAITSYFERSKISSCKNCGTSF
ncbi:hypothetical protein F5B21DRAFT_502917 [Xylaria acuta]|nr:hypothetical protein F5B21DRAFT_502917 [Xylaria acuta]